ncbi:hypothetical protein KEM52_006365 [Ascosphaera acerosa]|nr:hypothetical protein KEM52_006365 [Ascosphaera acerosa]
MGFRFKLRRSSTAASPEKGQEAESPSAGPASPCCCSGGVDAADARQACVREPPVLEHAVNQPLAPLLDPVSPIKSSRQDHNRHQDLHAISATTAAMQDAAAAVSWVSQEKLSEQQRALLGDENHQAWRAAAAARVSPDWRWSPSRRSARAASLDQDPALVASIAACRQRYYDRARACLVSDQDRDLLSSIRKKVDNSLANGFGGDPEARWRLRTRRILDAMMYHTDGRIPNAVVQSELAVLDEAEDQETDTEDAAEDEPLSAAGDVEVHGLAGDAGDGGGDRFD